MLNKTAVATTAALLIAPGLADADLSRKEVTKIVKRELAKARPGLKGDPGPPGADAWQLYAHVTSDGAVDLARSSPEITQENVARIAYGNDDTAGVAYCLSGLPIVSGGQVTVDAVGRESIKPTAYLDLDIDDEACQYVVSFTNDQHREVDSNFYLLLYGEQR